MLKRYMWLIFCAISQVRGANILIVFNAPSRSHHILGEALGLGLAEHGHEVTMISPFVSVGKHPRYKEIILDGENGVENAKKRMGNLFETRSQSVIGMFSKITEIGLTMANDTLHHPKVIDLLKSDVTFDIVIAEIFLNECLLGLAQYFNAIPIMMGTGGAISWTNNMVGNPSNAAYDIIPFMPFSNPMTYLERLSNTACSVLDALFTWYNVRGQQVVYDQYFKPKYRGHPNEFPHLSALITNVSLVLLNSNIVVSYPRALVPNMVNVGGLHIKPNKLPNDLQRILDEAKHGVIYFSMGSNLKSSQMPKSQRDAILKTFSKLKEIVLWKWEDDELPNKPKNVIIRSWMPQQSILNHTNVKLFITHGGLLSSIEALYFGIPLLGIPIFGDQYMNMARAVQSGYGLKLELNDITEDIFSDTINNILHDSRYQHRAMALSKIFRDELQSPIEKAVHSVEYVLRHNGAPFLRSPATTMSLYQTLLLDVVAGFIVILLGSILLLVVLVKKVYALCCKRTVQTVFKIDTKKKKR